MWNGRKQKLKEGIKGRKEDEKKEKKKKERHKQRQKQQERKKITSKSEAPSRLLDETAGTSERYGPFPVKVTPTYIT